MQQKLNPTKTVALCLAVWSNYSGNMTQQDKEYFENHLSHTTQQGIAAAQLLITNRLAQDGAANPHLLARELIAPLSARLLAPLITSS